MNLDQCSVLYNQELCKRKVSDDEKIVNLLSKSSFIDSKNLNNLDAIKNKMASHYKFIFF